MSFYDRVMNFMADRTKAETPMKTEGGVKYPASDYAYVPDKTKPSTWKLRMSEGRAGNITLAQLGRAAAAFSAGGFRGKKVEIPQDKIAGVKRKLRAHYKKLDAKPPDSIKSKENLIVWKEKDAYKFIAVYSNNFRDNDNPPEIISEKSHKRFDEMLSKGEVPYPELWLWHVPEWKVGRVKGHVYDNSGFPVAFGEFDKGKEAIAEWYMNSESDIRMSHGMPSSSIVRDENDASIIIEHVTREISLLPAQAAANKLTGFSVLSKEENVSIPEGKRAALIDEGISAETLALVEESNATIAQQAKESGLESKEESLDETATETAAEEGSDEGDTSEVVAPDAITREEIAEAIGEANKQFSDALKQRDEVITALAQQVSDLVKALTEEKATEEAKVAEKAAYTPALSLVDMIRGASVTKATETLLKEDELTSTPKEAKEDNGVKLSPIPFINNIMQSGR